MAIDFEYYDPDECQRRTDSKYRMVLLAAKRAKELLRTRKVLVETGKKKLSSIALEEVLAGKVVKTTGEADEAASSALSTGILDGESERRSPGRSSSERDLLTE
jgi:DNA-directed RNA polymerase omega subunit